RFAPRRDPAAAAAAPPTRLEVRDHHLAMQGAGFRQAVCLVVGRLQLLEVVDLAAQLPAREQRSDLRLSELIRDFHQPVAQPAAGVDDVAASTKRVDALEQLRPRHVQLVAEHAAGDEVVGALEQQREDDRVLTEIGPMAVTRRGDGRRHQAPSTIRLRSTAGAECVRAPTDTYSTPVAATRGSRSSVMPPLASNGTRPRTCSTALRSSSSPRLSRRSMSAPASSASSICCGVLT